MNDLLGLKAENDPSVRQSLVAPRNLDEHELCA